MKLSYFECVAQGINRPVLVARHGPGDPLQKAPSQQSPTDSLWHYAVYSQGIQSPMTNGLDFKLDYLSKIKKQEKEGYISEGIVKAGP